MHKSSKRQVDYKAKIFNETIKIIANFGILIRKFKIYYCAIASQSDHLCNLKIFLFHFATLISFPIIAVIIVSKISPISSTNSTHISVLIFDRFDVNKCHIS